MAERRRVDALNALDANGEVAGYHHTPRPLPELYAQAASELHVAIERLEAWKVPVPADSRLRVGIERLRAGVERYPTSLVEQRELSAALVAAVNFKAIVASLPATSVRSLRADLREAVRGALVPTAGARGPQQLESQHLIGGALHLAGVPYSHPPVRRNQTSGPDFTLTLASTEHGAEVKRPENRDKLLTHLEKAVDQLFTRRVVGLAVVDVTDVLLDGSTQDARQAIIEMRDELALAVVDRKLRRVAGYDHIGAVYLFARFPRMHVADGKSLLVVEHWGAAASFEDETMLASEAVRDRITAGLLRSLDGW